MLSWTKFSLGKTLYDIGYELPHAAQAPSCDTFVSNLKEGPLYKIEPSAANWCEVHLKPIVPFKPALHNRYLLGSLDIVTQVYFQRLGCSFIHLFGKRERHLT